MAVAFEGTLSQARFRQIQALGLRSARFFMFLFAGVLLLAVAFGSPELHAEPRRFVPRLVPPVALLLVSVFLPRLVAGRAWAQSKLLHGKFSGTVDESGIVWNSAFGSSTFPWSVVIKSRSLPNLVLLYTGPQQALFFAREFFSTDDDWQSFRTLVEANGPRKGRGRAA